MRVTVLAAVTLALLGCHDAPKTFTTTMEVMQVEPMKDEKGLTTYSLELQYADCPGETRRVLRAGKEFAACADKVKAGDKLKTELNLTYQPDRGTYRSDVLKLGDCTVKQDSKDDTNYEMVQNCTDVVTTGAVVGVRCDRTRSPQILAKCPFLKRQK